MDDIDKKIKLVQELEQKQNCLLCGCCPKLPLSMRLKKVNYSWQNANC